MILIRFIIPRMNIRMPIGEWSLCVFLGRTRGADHTHAMIFLTFHACSVTIYRNISIH